MHFLKSIKLTFYFSKVNSLQGVSMVSECSIQLYVDSGHICKNEKLRETVLPVPMGPRQSFFFKKVENFVTLSL